MDKRYLRLPEAAEYLNVSKCTADKYCQEWGAKKKIGRVAVYDRLIIDRAMSGPTIRPAIV